MSSPRAGSRLSSGWGVGGACSSSRGVFALPTSPGRRGTRSVTQFVPLLCRTRGVVAVHETNWGRLDEHGRPAATRRASPSVVCTAALIGARSPSCVRREDEQSVLAFIDDDVVAEPVSGQRHAELALGLHLPHCGIWTPGPSRPSDGSLMEACATGRGIHSHPHACPKASIYGQFPSQTHSHRPSPRPFTQEIAGSNPAGGIGFGPIE